MSVDVPVTTWQPTSGNGEYSSSTANNIVDTSDDHLIDPSGVFIVDTGVTYNPVPATLWTEDDSV